tara:strand:- start:617 stop:1471 length:855 start_codon:yes stop_codon:yes gene_type:complete
MKKITLLAALLVAFGMNAQIFSDDFETDVIDATTFNNWTSLDEDGDGEFWEVADMATYAATDAPAHPMQSNAADSDSWEGTPFSPDNFLITTTPIDLTNYSGTSVTFTVGTYQTNGSFIADKYSVYMSTSNTPADIIAETPLTTRTVGDDCPSDQADGSASAATLTIDASAYDGQVVYLTFRHYDTTDENSVLIDDVVVDGTLAVGDESFSNFFYVMDSNNQLKISANNPFEGIEVYNMLGQLSVAKTLSSNVEVVDLSALTSGVYIAKVSVEGQSRSIKIVKR